MRTFQALFAATAVAALAGCAQMGPVTTTTMTTPSGIVYQSLREGSGTSPVAADNVRVHYRGTLADGTEFDSSYKRGQPAQFGLTRVVKCWTEGVALMKPGGKAKLTCPPSTAYGERGVPGAIPPNATLTFEIELLEIVR